MIGTATDTAEILRERLEERRKAKGISPRALSLAIGANHSYVAQLLNGKGGVPSADKLLGLARELGTTTEYLTGESLDPGPVRSEVTISDRRLAFHGFPSPDEPGIPLVGTGDCADLRVMTEQGAEIEIERASFDPDYHVQYIHRPPALRGNTQAYAIYFHGSSMEPRFYAGEVGIADPTRPAAPGDHVVVQISNGDGPDVISVLVKRLVRQSSKEVVLEQYNPALTFTLPRAKVVRLHRIIPPTEQLLM